MCQKFDHYKTVDKIFDFDGLFYQGKRHFRGFKFFEIPSLIFREFSKTVFKIFLAQLGLELDWGMLSTPPTNFGPNWARKILKTVLESSQKMSLGLLSARKTKNVI